MAGSCIHERASQRDLPASVTTADFGCGGVETGTSMDSRRGNRAQDGTGAQLLPHLRLFDRQLGQAKDYAIAQGITIVTTRGWPAQVAAMHWTVGSPDANSRRCASERDSVVNSAGNEAQHHWSGAFVDANGNSYHDFASATNSIRSSSEAAQRYARG